jgi:hypothetical protein
VWQAGIFTPGYRYFLHLRCPSVQAGVALFNFSNTDDPVKNISFLKWSGYQLPGTVSEVC